MSDTQTSSRPDEQGYNGYANRQTWLTSLWLDNEVGTYTMLSEWAKEVETSYDLETMVKDFVEENNPLATTPSLYSDLLNHAIAMIEWHEVVNNYLNERKPVDQDDA